jgi:hypothetical protein
MPLVLQYAHLRKKNAGEHSWLRFTPLRAVGLAVEEGHRLSKARGLGQVTAASLSTVKVSGSAVQVLEDRRWRAVSQCQLQLNEVESSFALSVVQKHRALFSSLQLNLWEADLKMPRRLGSYDLLGDFSLERNFGVGGRVWVELKVISAHHFNSQLQSYQAKLEQQLAKVNEADPTVEAVLLVAAKAQRDGRRWQSPQLVAKLHLMQNDTWQALNTPSFTVRGKANPCSKPGLQAVWNQMEWVDHPTTQTKVGFLNHFLKALKLPRKTLGKRSKAFNKVLANAGLSDRLETVCLPNTSGQQPWVATKAAFRCLYNAL